MSMADLDVISKRQRACETTTQAALDECLNIVQSCRLSISRGEAAATALSSCDHLLKSKKLSKSAASSTIEYHDAIKVVGKTFVDSHAADLNATMRVKRLDAQTLLKVVLDHLYREGLFDVGDTLSREVDIEGTQAKDIFSNMHALLKQIHEGKLEDTLAWAIKNRGRLSRPGAPSKLEFNLRRLVFLAILQRDGTQEALSYARQHFPAFHEAFLPEVKQLMGTMLFVGRPLQQTPYCELTSPTLLDEVATDFVREACGLLAQACQSPLSVAVAAGAVALPQLLKLTKVAKGNMFSPSDSVSDGDHMPIELELGPEFNFHSIFACPVSKEMTDNDNPPLLLPCGHVLSKQSVTKISTLRHHQFKCPYCPQETELRFCRRLHFPDVQ